MATGAAIRPKTPDLYDSGSLRGRHGRAAGRRRRIERAVVGGLSLGGYLSLAFHLRHPERVRALMLFDCGPGFRRDEPRQAWNERSRKRGERIAAGDARALAELEPDGHRDLAGIARAARHMMRHRDGSVMESLPSIRTPALVLAGERDTPFLAGIDYMARKIPNARKIVLPDAGHIANVDNPEAFNAAVSAFLARLPA